MLGIYSVRRHRRDDHRGHFAIWRLGVMAAAAVSCDCVTGVHRLVQGALERFGGAAPGGSMWVAIFAFVFGDRKSVV